MQTDEQHHKCLLGQTGEVQNYQEQDNALIVTVMICKVGSFTDANGTKFTLTKENLQSLVNTYNHEVAAEYGKVRANKKEPIGRIFLETLLRKKTPELSIDEIPLAPVTTEHTLHNSFLVGRVIGRLEYKDISESYAEIWGKLFIATPEYVNKVKGGIFNQISLAFYPEINKIEEVSFTIYGAIDGAQIIRMSQNGIKPDKLLLAKTIGELSKKLSIVNTEIEDINASLTAARNKRSVDGSVLGLIACGKVYPRDRELLVNNLLKMSSDNDRSILLSTLKVLPNAIDLRIHNRNKLAFKMEELVMSKDKTVLVQTAEDISNAVQESLKLSKNNNDNNNAENAQASINLSSPKDEGAQFTSEHAGFVCDMLKNGKADDALNYLQKFTGEAVATEQIQQTALSQNLANEKTGGEVKLEADKSNKEEIKFSILSQISKLTDLLHKLP